jgi:hypothetical protein
MLHSGALHVQEGGGRPMGTALLWILAYRSAASSVEKSLDSLLFNLYRNVPLFSVSVDRVDCACHLF